MPDQFSSQAFYRDLVKYKLIIPVGVPGAFGRGAVFEDVLRRFDDLVTRVAKGRRRGGDGVSAHSRSRRLREERVPRFLSAAGGDGVQLHRQRSAAQGAHGARPRGKTLGRSAVDDRCGADAGGLLSRVPELHRRRSGQRAARRHAELGLPARAVARADAHAGLPRARVRARGEPRNGRRVARHVARARRSVCSRRSACRRAPTWPPIRSSAAAGGCSP